MEPARAPAAGAMLEVVVRHDRVVTLGSLAAVIALCWAYLLSGAGMSMAMATVAWTPAHALVVFVMWAVMMAAMMLPSAAPMILLYATVARNQHASGGPTASTGVFVSGYIAVWTAFSAAAVALEFALDEARLLNPMMQATSNGFAVAVLIAAGIYQWTPLKQACLRHCRSPLHFVLTHWRAGTRGAFIMGVRHGVYCAGCCWMMMLLLFVAGIMNLAGIAALAAFILLEKLAPAGAWISRIAGTLLIGWGGVTWLFA